MKTPSLFDEPEIAPELNAQETSDADVSDDEWHEATTAVFLSWSDARQWDHCWRRDLFAATHDDDTEWQQFYLTRAADYKRLRDEAVNERQHFDPSAVDSSAH